MNPSRHARAPGAGGTTSLRAVVAAVLAAALAAMLAACSRGPDTSGDTPQVAAAKGAIAHRLGTMATPEFRNIVEFRDGVVCGDFDSHKMFSGGSTGFRRFIFNAPEAGALVIDAGNLTRQEIGYWCSEQPDKRLRMLAASYTELAQACTMQGGKSSETSCRLAAEQKRALDELQAASGRPANPRPDAPIVAASGTQRPASVASATAAAPATPAAPAAQGPASAASVAAAPSPAASSAEAAVPAEVQAALESWRRAWQDGDVDSYLRMYEDSFSGDAGSHARWAQQRRQKMQGVRPTIGIEKMRAVRVSAQEVELQFIQVYAARQHRDTGEKTLTFRRSPRGWLIAGERWRAAK